MGTAIARARTETTSCTTLGAKTICMRGGEGTPCTGAAGATHFTARRVRTSPTVAPETTTWGATATSTPIAARTRSTAAQETTTSSGTCDPRSTLAGGAMTCSWTPTQGGTGT